MRNRLYYVTLVFILVTITMLGACAKPASAPASAPEEALSPTTPSRESQELGVGDTGVSGILEATLDSVELKTFRTSQGELEERLVVTITLRSLSGKFDYLISALTGTVEIGGDPRRGTWGPVPWQRGGIVSETPRQFEVEFYPGVLDRYDTAWLVLDAPQSEDPIAFKLPTRESLK